MTKTPQRRRWAPIVAAAALLAALALLVGCYHPHRYRHHARDGWYAYDHRGHRDHDRRDHRDRSHDRRHRHHAGCGH